MWAREECGQEAHDISCQFVASPCKRRGSCWKWLGVFICGHLSHVPFFPFYLPFKNVLTFERTVKGYIFLSSADNSSNLLWLPCTLPEYRMLFQLCTEVGTVVKDHARLSQELQPSQLSLLLHTQLKDLFMFYCIYWSVCVTRACMHTQTHAHTHTQCQGAWMEVRVISLSEHVSPRTKLILQAWGRVFYQLNILEGPWKYFFKGTAILNMRF